MSRTRRPKALDVTELQVFATALIKYFGAQPLTLNGTAYTPQQFKDKVDAYVALLADAAESKTAWVNRLNAVDTAVRAFVSHGAGALLVSALIASSAIAAATSSVSRCSFFCVRR